MTTELDKGPHSVDKFDDSSAIAQLSRWKKHRSRDFVQHDREKKRHSPSIGRRSNELVAHNPNQVTRLRERMVRAVSREARFEEQMQDSIWKAHALLSIADLFRDDAPRFEDRERLFRDNARAHCSVARADVVIGTTVEGPLPRLVE
jgi:hypothetical protein